MKQYNCVVDWCIWIYQAAILEHNLYAVYICCAFCDQKPFGWTDKKGIRSPLWQPSDFPSHSGITVDKERIRPSEWPLLVAIRKGIWPWKIALKTVRTISKNGWGTAHRTMGNLAKLRDGISVTDVMSHREASGREQKLATEIYIECCHYVDYGVMLLYDLSLF